MVLEKITNFMDQHQMLPEGGLILAAVSGGADSMCLLTALMELTRTRDFSLAVVHYNHRLRGGASDEDARFVERFCREQGIRCFVGAGDVAGYALQNGLGTEEAAREMRYDYFFSVAEEQGAEKIATAHTADDNAETILMNLTRGTGLRGLCGIPPTRGKLIRPLLAVTRAEVENALQAQSVPYTEDATNAETIYTRNKIRHQVMPVLKEINPNFPANLRDFSERLRRDEDYLCSLAEEFVERLPETGRVRTEKWPACPHPLRSGQSKSWPAGNCRPDRSHPS
jgi:tRNA(Ile)-lysidine synthase